MTCDVLFTSSVIVALCVLLKQIGEQ